MLRKEQLKKEVAVVVPVYLPCLNLAERKSFSQCCRVLNSRCMFLVTFSELDCSEYNSIASSFGIILKRIDFEKHFFDGIAGYNQLMMSKNFYLQFSHYRYVLIYQLDAWVFRDELDSWCAKGFDYVGAPWFEGNRSHEEGASLWAVGNGGFSLRRVRTFIDLFSQDKRVYSIRHCLKEAVKSNNGKRFETFCKLFKIRFSDLVAEWDDAEDLFYCLRLKGTRLELRVPSVEEAMSFAFEQSPSYLFGLTKILPFGCHAWRKYEQGFWNRFIGND
jgi:hypothetical protein